MDVLIIDGTSTHERLDRLGHRDQGTRSLPYNPRILPFQEFFLPRTLPLPESSVSYSFPPNPLCWAMKAKTVFAHCLCLKYILLI